MKLFGKEEVNISRQFEFDMAKAVCIIGMVFVHCFEELPMSESLENGTASYIFLTILNTIFGAGTFMISMGLGIAYSWKGNADKLIKRGILLFVLGYVLNAARCGILETVLAFTTKPDLKTYLTTSYFLDDILQFAGMALLFFGLLKKLHFSDLALFITAFAMSTVGSFFRFLDLGSQELNMFLGVLIGTVDPVNPNAFAPFPLSNWFIIVVLGYLYAKALRRCTNIKKYYAISFPVSAVLLVAYMAFAVPLKLGIFNDDMNYYYQLTVPETLVLLTGAVFATGLYHYVSLLFSNPIKKAIEKISVNLNKIYLIHWVILGNLSVVLKNSNKELTNGWLLLALGTAIFVVSVLIAEAIPSRKEKKNIVAEKGKADIHDNH